MNWPENWEEWILDGNVIVVVGAAKSGLTNLCNLFASLKPVYYIYGNTILKAMPVGKKEFYQMVRSVFLYDYVIPWVRGIRSCELPCAVEDKLLWARLPEERLKKLKLNLGSIGALYYAAANRAYYVTDVLDGCVRWKEYETVFKNCTIIHIVRNGFDVIAARKFLKWDNPLSQKFACGPVVDWASNGRPWYAEDSWDSDWNIETKIAHLWRIQVNSLPVSVFYENLVAAPVNCLSSLLDLSPILFKTPASDAAVLGLREIYVKQIQSHVTLKDIQEPERQKFKEAMEKFGYL